MNKNHSFFTRVTAMLLALVCVLGLLPATALAAPPDTVKLEDCTYNGVQYDSPALGTCRLQQMRFDCGGPDIAVSWEAMPVTGKHRS